MYKKINKKSDVSYPTEEKIVRHALGMIDGNNMTNSLETLEESYNSFGYRFIEVDLSVTSDGYLVCSHGFAASDYMRGGMKYAEESNVPTLEEFKNCKVFGQYTPMTLDDLMEWIKEHKDTCFIFDVKEADYEECTEIAKQIKKAAGKNKKVYNRIIFSARNTGMVKASREAGVFKWIHLWMAPPEIIEDSISTPEAFIEFCKENGVVSWSIEGKYLTEELAEKMADSGMKCYVYMVETEAEMALYDKLGADFFISDTLKPNQFEGVLEYQFFINYQKVNGDKYIEIGWSDCGTDCEYEVYREAEKGDAVKIGETEECIFKDTEIEAGVLYGYYVKVKGTEEVTPDYYIATVAKPQDVVVTQGTDYITVTWERIDCADGYLVRRSLDGENWTTIFTFFDGDETTFTDDTMGVAYKIQAYTVINNKRYYSGYSSAVYAEEGKAQSD